MYRRSGPISAMVSKGRFGSDLGQITKPVDAIECFRFTFFVFNWRTELSNPIVSNGWYLISVTWFRVNFDSIEIKSHNIALFV